MHATRGELEWALDDLERRLPRLIRDHIAKDDFWAVFHAYADPIMHDACAEDGPFVRERIDAMLAPHGLELDAS
jgi:hypothetical protein